MAERLRPGDEIPNSRWFHALCCHCGEAMRAASRDRAERGFAVCLDCVGEPTSHNNRDVTPPWVISGSLSPIPYAEQMK
jgi:hypothetical protein